MTTATEITTPIALAETDNCTITSPWFLGCMNDGVSPEFHPTAASYEPLVNGEAAFGALYDAILAAKKTIDYICWGFQPSMYFKRNGADELCIGDLMIKKAAEGVVIRILCWGDSLLVSQFSENSMPGDGLTRSLAFQNENNTQREYDRKWYALTAMNGSPEDQDARREYAERHPQPTGSGKSIPAPVTLPCPNIQVVRRDFGLFERVEIMWRETFHRADKGLSEKAVALGYGAEPSHHQKMVVIDYELPQEAVGFVMGHNTLDAYWDTNAHSYARMHARFGRNGATPRQDMSARVTGPILEHLNVNFCNAWKRSTDVDLLARRKQLAKQLKVRPEKGTPVMAQIARTQSQEGVFDIKKLYLQNANNIINFMYIENQYFRWETLAEKIKGLASTYKSHNKPDPIYLFVVTNSTEEAVGPGTVSTYNMLHSLGRDNQISKVARLERLDQLSTQQSDLDGKLWYGSTDQASMNKTAAQLKEVNQQIYKTTYEPDKVIVPIDIPGLQVIVCTLVAPDSPGSAWMPVYVHSKIAIIDDVYLTHGSANINSRSMEVDSELNICHEHGEVTKKLRQTLWGIHTNGRGVDDGPGDAFANWTVVAKKNKDNQVKKIKPIASLVEFNFNLAKRSRLD